MKKNVLLIIGLLLFVVSLSTISFTNGRRTEAVSGTYNVLNYGARGDGETLDTKAIKEAIERAAKDCGGTVYFPAGKYISGTFFLRSNVCLHLEARGILAGSNDMIDIDGCRNVIIKGVIGDSDDDGITFKITYGRGWGTVPRVLFRKDQEVTIAKYLSKERPQLLLYSGKTISCPAIPPTGACRTNVTTTLSGLEKGTDLKGHHLIMIYGDYVKQLKRSSQLYNIEVVV